MDPEREFALRELLRKLNALPTGEFIDAVGDLDEGTRGELLEFVQDNPQDDRS